MSAVERGLLVWNGRIARVRARARHEERPQAPERDGRPLPCADAPAQATTRSAEAAEPLPARDAS